MSNLLKNKAKSGAQAPKGAQVRMVPVPDNFEIISEAEAKKIHNREKALRSAERKLAEYNRGSKQPRVVAKSLTDVKEQDLRYLLSLLDPFTYRGVPVPNIIGGLTGDIQIPGKTTFSTFDNFTMEVIASGANAGKGFLVAPCHYAACWAATGNSAVGALTNSTNSPPTVWQHEYMTAGSATTWPNPSQPTLVYDTTSGGRTHNMFVVNQFTPSKQAATIINNFDVVRMVSGGVKLTNIGEVLGVKGKMAAAWLPPGVLPANVNTALSGDMMVGTPFDLDYETIATLPGAQIFSAGDSIEVTLIPMDPSAYEYCPTAYLPTGYKYSGSGRGIGTYQCPPCVGYPEKFKALMDAGMLGTWGSTTAFSVAAPADSRLNPWAIGGLLSPDTPMGCVVVAFDGCDPDGSFDVQIVANYEAINNTRSLTFGHAGTVGYHATPHPSATKAVSVAATVPRARKSDSGVLPKLVPFFKKAMQVGKSMLSNVGGPANAARWIASELGVEVPEVFGTLMEAGSVLGALAL